MISFPLRKTAMPAREFPRSPSHHLAFTGPTKSPEHAASMRHASNLSCMLIPATVAGIMAEEEIAAEPCGNVDWRAHTLPRLDLPYQGRVACPEFPMGPSRAELAESAWSSARVYNLESIDGAMSANPPSFIPISPVTLTVDRPKRVILENQEPLTLYLPATEPVDAGPWFAAWERRKPATYSPMQPQPAAGFYDGMPSSQPLPLYEPKRRKYVSQVDDGSSLVLVAAWLADPTRTVTRRKPDRLSRLMAQFWEHGDGRGDLQPVDARNQEIRSKTA